LLWIEWRIDGQFPPTKYKTIKRDRERERVKGVNPTKYPV